MVEKQRTIKSVVPTDIVNNPIFGKKIREEFIVLIADVDDDIRRETSEFFQKEGYKTIIAVDGAQALEMFTSAAPHIAIVDIHLPVLSGLQFLDEVRKNDYHTPIIITTSHPDVASAISAMQKGAYDYIVKPLQCEVLKNKISRALAAHKLSRENAALTELASLHSITSKLTITHNLPELLDAVFQCCLETSGADSGSVMLIEKATKELVLVRQKGIHNSESRSSLQRTGEWPVAKWVFRNEQSLLITSNTIIPDIALPLQRTDIQSALCVPIKVADDIIGVINLNRVSGREPFTKVHRNMIEVLATQAGVAINNATIYSSINQKLTELSLISSYSEQLMGQVERDDVIRCLFDTTRQYFAVDLIGVLIAEKRYNTFLYWAQGTVSPETLRKITRDIIAESNRRTRLRFQKKKIVYRQLSQPLSDNQTISHPFQFSHCQTLMVGGDEYGGLYVGAAKLPDNTKEKMSLLSSLINQTQIALTNARLYSDMKENYIKTIKALAIAVDAKDTYTHGHSENVMRIAQEIALELHLEDKVVSVVRDSGLLHDIGKIGIPGYILNKPGSLTYNEFNGVMKTHCTLGANIVRDVPFLHELYQQILYHHENFDGSGYPQGLRGREIPIGARILHVADAFEAMTSNRPYRESLGTVEAIRRLKQEQGKQFDPAVVDAFVRVAKKSGWIGTTDID